MRVFVLAATMLSFSAPAVAQTDGAFTLNKSSRSDRLNLNLQYADGRSNHGRSFERSAFTDIKQDGDRITFRLQRAPGTFTFEGRGSMERASGWFVFAPNADFSREMDRIGFRDLDERAMFTFALDDLTIAKVKQLQGLVSNQLDTDELIRLINHGAGLTHIQALTDAGFKKLTSDEYRRARDHGVSMDFVREMSTLGIKIPLEDLIRMRDHGVTPEFVRGMRDAGHDVSHDELVRARDHGVTPAFVKRMSDLGYKGLSLDEYVRFRDHGVTPDYVEALRNAGLTKISADQLVRARDHGVTASYVRRVRERFKEMPSIEEIIRLRSRGALDDR